MNQDQIAALKAAAEKATGAWIDSVADITYRSVAKPSAILAMLAERDALIARAEAAESDSRRIDYLSSGASIVQDDEGFLLFWHTSGRCGPTRASRREAIDAAMQQEAGE